MKSCVNYIVLVAGIILACFGGQDSTDRQEVNAADYSVAKKSQASLTGDEQHRFIDLQRAEEQITSVNSFPGSPSKDNQNSFSVNSYTVEISIWRIANQYIALSKFLDRGLTNCDIIFPFHYFW